MRHVFMFLIFSFFFSFEIAGQSDWTMINGGPDLRSFVENETILAPPLKVERTMNIFADDYALKGDILIAQSGGAPHVVKAYSWSSGAELWSFEIPGSGGGLDDAPAIYDDVVLCGGQNGDGLYALNIIDGSIKWMHPFGSLYMCNPVVFDGRVYIVKDSLYCIDLQRGDILWTYPAGGQLTAAVDENNVYVPGAVLDRITGVKKYDIFSNSPNVVIDEQRVYYEYNNEIYAINKSDGSVVWHTVIDGGPLPLLNGGAISVSDGYLCYVIWQNPEGNGAIFTLDKSNGALLWDHVFDGLGALTPVVANGVVYVVPWRSKTLWGFNLPNGDVVLESFGGNFSENFIIADHAILISSSEGLKVLTSSATDVDDENNEANPEDFKLCDNYPNPFSKSSGGNSSTTIKFSIPSSLETQGFSSQPTTLRVYDILGKEVATLVNEKLSAGEYEVKFNAVGLPAGVYLYQLKAGSYRKTKKMILLK